MTHKLPTRTTPVHDFWGNHTKNDQRCLYFFVISTKSQANHQNTRKACLCFLGNRENITNFVGDCFMIWRKITNQSPTHTQPESDFLETTTIAPNVVYVLCDFPKITKKSQTHTHSQREFLETSRNISVTYNTFSMQKTPMGVEPAARHWHQWDPLTKGCTRARLVGPSGRPGSWAGLVSVLASVSVPTFVSDFVAVSVAILVPLWFRCWFRLQFGFRFRLGRRGLNSGFCFGLFQFHFLCWFLLMLLFKFRCRFLLYFRMLLRLWLRCQFWVWFLLWLRFQCRVCGSGLISAIVSVLVTAFASVMVCQTSIT